MSDTRWGLTEEAPTDDAAYLEGLLEDVGVFVRDVNYDGVPVVDDLAYLAEYMNLKNAETDAAVGRKAEGRINTDNRRRAALLRALCGEGE